MVLQEKRATRESIELPAPLGSKLIRSARSARQDATSIVRPNSLFLAAVPTCSRSEASGAAGSYPFREAAGGFMLCSSRQTMMHGYPHGLEDFARTGDVVVPSLAQKATKLKPSMHVVLSGLSGIAKDVSLHSRRACISCTHATPDLFLGERERLPRGRLVSLRLCNSFCYLSLRACKARRHQTGRAP